MTTTTFTDADRQALVDRYPVNDVAEMHVLLRRTDDPVKAEKIVQDYVPAFPAPDDAAPDWAEDVEPWSWGGHGDGWMRSLSVTAVVPGFTHTDTRPCWRVSTGRGRDAISGYGSWVVWGVGIAPGEDSSRVRDGLVCRDATLLDRVGAHRGALMPPARRLQLDVAELCLVCQAHSSRVLVQCGEPLRSASAGRECRNDERVCRRGIGLGCCLGHCTGTRRRGLLAGAWGTGRETRYGERG